MTAEQIDTCSKKVRGMAQKSLDLIVAMYAAAEAAQPITGAQWLAWNLGLPVREAS